MGSSDGIVIDTKAVDAIVVFGGQSVLRRFHLFGKEVLAWRDLDGPINVAVKGEKGWGHWKGRSYPIIES